MLVDGRSTTLITVADRGFQYGDGCFTTLEVRQGVPLFQERHLQRLQRDYTRLRIPFDQTAALHAELAAMAAEGGNGVLKVILTRGAGGRGYRCPEPPQPSRVLSFHPMPEYPTAWASAGVALHLCKTRLGINPALAGIKHLNRLEQILARAEWTDPDTPEGLLLDAQGCVTEGTMSNVFLVQGGVLTTPKLDRCGVAGVMREMVMELAAGMGLRVRQRRCRLADVYQADEVFLSNCLIGLWPVRRLGEHAWRPGPCFQRLHAAVANAKQEAAACAA